MSVVRNVDFGEQVGEWVKQTEARMTAVFRESTQRLISIAANAVPVDTGFARASISVSSSEMPAINPRAVPARRRRPEEERGSLYPSRTHEIIVVINQAQIGEVIYVGWTAAYVLYLEYGSSMQAPNGFVRIAATQWDQIVDQVVAEAKVRAQTTSRVR